MTYYPPHEVTVNWKTKTINWYSITKWALTWWDDGSWYSEKYIRANEEIEYIKEVINRLEEAYEDSKKECVSESQIKEHWAYKKICWDDLISLRKKLQYLQSTLHFSIF